MVIIMVKLKEGENSINKIEKGFDDDWAYCWYHKEDKELWLSSILVKTNERRKGHLHNLLEKAKKFANKVVIPVPTRITMSTATKHGYEWKVIRTKDHLGEATSVGCMVWTKTE